MDSVVVQTINKQENLSLTTEVMSPKRPNFILSTHIPNIELDILICNRFDVEPHCWNRGDILIEFQLVEDR